MGLIEQIQQGMATKTAGGHWSKAVPAISSVDSPHPLGRSGAGPATFQEALKANSREGVGTTGVPLATVVPHGAAVSKSATGLLLAQPAAASVQASVSAVPGKTSKEVATQAVMRFPAGSAASLEGVKEPSVVLISHAKDKVEREKKSTEIRKGEADKAKASVGCETNEAGILPASKPITLETEPRSSSEVALIVPVDNRVQAFAPALTPGAVDSKATKEPIRKRSNALPTNMHAPGSFDIVATKRTGEREAAPHTEASTTGKETVGTAGPNLSAKDHALTQVASVAATTGIHAAPGRLLETASSGNGAMEPRMPTTSAPIHSEQPEMKTLLATSNVLEIGVGDGTHGWLRVRAELDRSGEVTASLVAVSAGAAEKLHRELPDMSDYLRGEQVAISSLVVHATAKSSPSPEQAMSAGAGAGTGADASSSSQGDRERTTHADANAAISKASSSRHGLVDTESSLALVGVTPMLSEYGSGGWLNVRV